MINIRTTYHIHITTKEMICSNPNKGLTVSPMKGDILIFLMWIKIPKLAA